MNIIKKIPSVIWILMLLVIYTSIGYMIGYSQGYKSGQIDYLNYLNEILK